MTSTHRADKIRKSLLGWYDKHRRSLPWRAPKGDRAAPYHVWLSEIMLQQTTVQAVAPYFLKFIQKWPDVHTLAAATQEEVMHEWAGLGYYARARNLHKCAKEIAAGGGAFPDTQAELKKLPGIGEYTSAAITAIAFNKTATVVDGNVERVMSRLYDIHTPLPRAKKELKAKAEKIFERENSRPGDLAQAMMDLGAAVCTPKSPKCALCPINEECRARKNGTAETLPAKEKKKEKPQKYGYFYWIADKKRAVLFQRRAETEMMGGMLGLPTSEWGAQKDHIPHPLELKNVKKLGHNYIVRHSFTHFDLELEGCYADQDAQTVDSQWIPQEGVQKLGLPTLFKKAVKLMI